MILTSRQKEHRKFINSREWKDIRIKLFNIRGKKCEVCGATKDIQVHHLNYKRFGGKERLTDLQILCRKHHQKIHGLSPKKNKLKENKRGLGTYKQILIDKYKVSKKCNGWKRLAEKLSIKLTGERIIFRNGYDAKDYIINHVQSIDIDINTVKVTFNKKNKKSLKKKEFKQKVILRKK